MAEDGGEEKAAGVESATPDVFISYASHDSAVANDVTAALEGQGLKCWIAPRDVTPGAHYSSEIVHAIDSAKAIVLILSQTGATSPHVLREIERATSKRSPVVTLRLDQAPLPAEFQYFLNTSQWLDASGGDAMRMMPKVMAAVKSAINVSAEISTAALTSHSYAHSARARSPHRTAIVVTSLVGLVLAGFAADRLWFSSSRDAATPASIKLAVAPAPTPAAPTNLEGSIAVLPFTDMSEKKDQGFLADGLAEELLNLLTKVTPLRVISRSSAFSFKSQHLAIPEIGRRLNVAHILEGSVRRSGNHVRITAQLIDARSDTEVWSETYDRTLSDLFVVQDQIAGAVVAQLKIKLLGAVPAHKAVDPKAYALYLQARQVGRIGTADGYRQSIEFAKQALAVDPTYANAWVGLSNIYLVQAAKGLRPVDEGYRLAREAANRALALDPKSALALVNLSRISGDHDDDLAAAARYLERALALEPSDADVIRATGNLAHDLGRLDQAVKFDEYAVSGDPVSAAAHGALGYDYARLGRLNEAIASYRMALKLSPGRIGSQYNISELLMRKGEARAALEAVQSETDENWRRVGLPMVYYSLKRSAESNAALADLVAHQSTQWAYNIAYVMAWRGEADHAFEWLEKAATLRDPGLVEIVDEPMMANIRRDPRWLPFLRKIGRAPAQLAEIKFNVRLPESRGPKS